MAAVIDDVDLERDRDLVIRAQQGDDEAFAQLYSRYHQRLIRFASRRVGNPGDAEEIAQETFARAYRALPSFAGERRFYPWLTVIASRLCIDWLRRASRVEIGEVTDHVTVDADFDRLEREGDMARLGIALDRLCDRHREVLEFRIRDGWSYQQIADHYRVSLGTVEALIWRARRSLRREYEGLASILIGIPLIRRFVGSHGDSVLRAANTLTAIGTVGALSLVGGAMAPNAAVVSAAAPAVAAVAAASPTTAEPAAVPATTPPTAVTPTVTHVVHSVNTAVQATAAPAIQYWKLTQSPSGKPIVDQQTSHLDLGIVGIGIGGNLDQPVPNLLEFVTTALTTLHPAP